VARAWLRFLQLRTAALLPIASDLYQPLASTISIADSISGQIKICRTRRQCIEHSVRWSVTPYRLCKSCQHGGQLAQGRKPVICPERAACRPWSKWDDWGSGAAGDRWYAHRQHKKSAPMAPFTEAHMGIRVTRAMAHAPDLPTHLRIGW